MKLGRFVAVISLTDWAYDLSIMTCRDVTIPSQTRHFEFEAAILNPKPAVIQLTMASPKNILSQKKHTKVKKLSSSYKRRGKT